MIAALALRSGVSPREWLAYPEILEHALTIARNEDSAQRREGLLDRLRRRHGA